MSRLEDRLRDAYRDEAGAVTPESIGGLGEAITARSQRPARLGPARRWSRWLTPLAAAAAVAVIVIVAALVVPHDTTPPRPSTTPATAPKFLIDDTTGVSPLSVRNATTGAFVAQVTVPPGYPGGNSRTYITSVATSNGRDYLVAEYANPCRSWIYQFRLDGTGRPSAVIPFKALPTVRSELYSLTMGRRKAALLQPAGGGAPGSAAAIGRTVAQTPSSRWISFSAISADGSEVYFSTFTTPGLHASGPMTGQIRVVNLATGRSRLVYAPAGSPGLITAAPGARYLLLQTQAQPARLVRLDLTTGKATDLPFSAGGVLYW